MLREQYEVTIVKTLEHGSPKRVMHQRWETQVRPTLVIVASGEGSRLQCTEGQLRPSLAATLSWRNRGKLGMFAYL